MELFTTALSDAHDRLQRFRSLYPRNDVRIRWIDDPMPGGIATRLLLEFATQVYKDSGLSGELSGNEKLPETAEISKEAKEKLETFNKYLESMSKVHFKDPSKQ